MDDHGTQSVRLMIPAHTRMLRFARVTAATLAVELSFTLEDIEDLRVAVDELATATIAGLDGSKTLSLTFDVVGSDLVVNGEVRDAGTMPALHPVAQELINMMTDTYELSDLDGSRLFRLVKSRSSDAG